MLDVLVGLQLASSDEPCLSLDWLIGLVSMIPHFNYLDYPTPGVKL